MTIKTTRWTSDVCGCVIDFTWDDSVPQEEITESVKNYVSKCPAHSALEGVDDQTRFNSAIEENQRKNRAHKEILDAAPSSLYELDSQSGQRQLKSGINLSWELTGEAPNRVMALYYSGINLTQTQKNNIQNMLDNKFGAGKVKLA
jgi:hypothetical protein